MNIITQGEELEAFQFYMEMALRNFKLNQANKREVEMEAINKREP